MRWTLAAAALAGILAVGGYGVIQASTSSTSGSSAGAATLPGGSGSRPAGAPAGGGSGPGSGARGTPPRGGKRGASPARGGGTVGKVTSISTDSITLTTMANKAVTVTVSASTVYKDGSATSTSAALKVGDVAMVTGSGGSNGTVRATVITFGTTPPGSPPKA